MEISKNAPAKRGKRQKPKVRITLPQTDEEKKAVQEVFGIAYTEAVISVIKRKFKNPEDQRMIYRQLIENMGDIVL